MSKELPATQAKGGVNTNSDLPEFLRSLGGVGNDNVTREDMVVPRLVLLQALSPQVKRSDPSYIEGAEQGDIINTVTGDVFKKGVLLVNCYFVHEFAVFKKRTAGGGFRGIFPTQKEASDFVSVHPESADLEVTEQGVHYCIVLDENKQPITEAAVVFQSTKMKVSRKWNSFIAMRQGAPRFAGIWKLSSVSEKNQKGDFYNFTVAPAGLITEELVEPAMAFYKAVSSGDRQVERKTGDDNPDVPEIDI